MKIGDDLSRTKFRSIGKPILTTIGKKGFLPLETSHVLTETVGDLSSDQVLCGKLYGIMY